MWACVSKLGSDRREGETIGAGPLGVKGSPFGLVSTFGLSSFFFFGIVNALEERKQHEEEN